MRSITDDIVGSGGFAIVVSLDIQNAFNSIPWRIMREKEQKGFPPYIRRVVDSYLSDRFIQYIGSDGKQCRRTVEAGVPQGSVLGPILWNITFDSVLDLADEDESCEILCYADDTLVIVSGMNMHHTRLRAGVFLTHVVNHIHSLGLRVAPNKTEAILFYPKGVRDLPVETLIGDTPIPFQVAIKYLGIMVDDKWNFNNHIKYIVDKVKKATRFLNRLMPNLRGPDEKRRRLYAGVINSIILYGAPIWGNVLLVNKISRLLFPIERTLAQWVISAYRTVSYNAVLLLARLPPIRYMAQTRKNIYERIALHRENGTLTKDILDRIKNEED